jgi:uncharacterized Zn-finger protein
MKCQNCQKEILQPNPKICPYCGTKILISEEESRKLEIEEIEQLERAGRYDDAAEKYEELKMWDEAGKCRRKANTHYVVSVNVDVGKIGTISIQCPYCGASQPITSKSNRVKCNYCGRDCIIPEKIIDLL